MTLVLDCQGGVFFFLGAREPFHCRLSTGAVKTKHATKRDVER